MPARSSLRCSPGPLAVLLLLLSSMGLQAQGQASGLQVAHRHGQSFVTWTELPSAKGESYRVYRAAAPIQTVQDLRSAELLAERPRGSGLHPDLAQGYVLETGRPPLASGTGFVAVTTPGLRVSHYAVTAVVGSQENVTLGPANSSAAVLELPAVLQPVLQRVTDQGRDRHYVHFAPEVDTPYARAQAAAAGRAYDYRVLVDGTTPGPRPVLMMLHPKGGDYLSWSRMSWAPLNTVQVFCDDDNPPGGNDFWFGYHEDYPGSPSAQSVVRDYSERRLLWTLDQVLADRTLLCDSGRVYAVGASLGAISAAGLGVRHPDRFAACGGLLPAFSFTHADFGLVAEAAALFGTPTQSLWCSLGRPVYDVFELGARLQDAVQSGVAPMRFTFGRGDTVTGWEDKPGFLQDVRRWRQPIAGYWDLRVHTTTGSWSNLESVLFAELLEIRLDRPLPVWTNVSLDDDPGNGNRFTGDPVGTVGGYVHFDPLTAWESTSLVRIDVGLRDDPTRLDYAPAARGYADVTFRRLRSFQVQSGSYYLVRSRASTGTTIFEERIVVGDANGLVTVRELELERGLRTLELSRHVPQLPELRFSGTLEVGGTLGMQVLAPGAQASLITLGSVPVSVPSPWGVWGIGDPVVLWSGATASSGLTEFLVPVPQDPRLRGLRLLGQALVWPVLTNVAQAQLR